MLRLFFAGVLSLLLVGLQHDVLVHALQHDAARISDSRDSGVHKAGGEGPCSLCALFAGGSDAASVAGGAGVARPPVDTPSWTSRVARFAPSATYYSSRAPPASYG